MAHRTLPSFALIGHRGSGKGLSPLGHVENTTASCLEAVVNGATWIETDIRMTRDGGLVRWHDPSIDGRTLSDLTTRDAVAAGAEHLDSLDDLPDHVGVDCEIKRCLADASRYPDVYGAFHRWFEPRRHQRPWMLSSFDPTVTRDADALDIPGAVLTDTDTDLETAITSALRLGADLTAVHADTVHPHRDQWLLDAAAHHHLGVMAWAAPAERAVELRTAGLIAVCTDFVPAAHATLMSDPSGTL